MSLKRSPRVRTAVIAAAAASVVALPAAALAAGSHVDNTSAARKAIQGGKARNVILLIGDGMGNSEITVARNYSLGAEGRLNLDRLPLTGAYTTYAIQKDNPALPHYVTDSAASGTGWATGHKTYNGAISVLPNGKPVPTILEKAKAAGFRTGDVSTAELVDATPAVLASHVVDRDCKGPQSMTACPSNAKENGGAGSIDEQLIATAPDVLLGGGKKYFDQRVQSGRYQDLSVLQQAQTSGYRVVTDTTALAAARPGAPLLDVFAAGNMDLEWVGPKPTPTGTPTGTCAPNLARSAGQPHLANMADKAIQLLDRESRGRARVLPADRGCLDRQAGPRRQPCGQNRRDRRLRRRREDGTGLPTSPAQHPRGRHRRPRPHQPDRRDRIHDHRSHRDPAHQGRRRHDDQLRHRTAERVPAAHRHKGTHRGRRPQAANVLGVTDQTELFHTMGRALGVSQ